MSWDSSNMGWTDSVQLSAVRRPGGEDLTRIDKDSPLPVNPHTRGPARPNVYMFGDGAIDWARVEEQKYNMGTWIESLPPDCKIAIVEIGAGKTIPTVRNAAEKMTLCYPNSTLIRINWDDFDIPDDMGIEKRSIGIGKTGALSILTQIDEWISKNEEILELKDENRKINEEL